MPGDTAAGTESRPLEAEPLEAFRERCRDWLAGQALPPAEDVAEREGPGGGVAVFHDLDHDDEAALLDRGRAWQTTRYQAGFGAIGWPVEHGGAGLTADHERVYAEEEARYTVGPSHEALRITANLAAPTLRELGTPVQRERFVASFLRCDELVCQLFSEPGAGSDLAAISTRAIADGETWVIDGAKVWTSGARFADWGFLIARSDPGRPKHQGLTAFLVPMRSPAVEVRPIRQMSGGASFSEVLLTGVRVPDELRVGEVGGGWRAALTMLGFERNQSGTKTGVGAGWPQLRELARRSGRGGDPAVRRQLVDVYMHERLRLLTRARADAARRMGQRPGPEGSIGKLLWSQGLTRIGEAAQLLLGPTLTADDGSGRGDGSGRVADFDWNQHVLGAPGFRIAGGSDEIQRTIIGERVLGLPAEPREQPAPAPAPSPASGPARAKGAP